MNRREFTTLLGSDFISLGPHLAWGRRAPANGRFSARVGLARTSGSQWVTVGRSAFGASRPFRAQHLNPINCLDILFSGDVDVEQRG